MLWPGPTDIVKEYATAMWALVKEDSFAADRTSGVGNQVAVVRPSTGSGSVLLGSTFTEAATKVNGAKHTVDVPELDFTTAMVAGCRVMCPPRGF